MNGVEVCKVKDVPGPKYVNNKDDTHTHTHTARTTLSLKPLETYVVIPRIL